MNTTFSDYVAIGQRRLYAEWSGEGTPVIVLDAGGPGAGCSTGAWNMIWFELAGLSSVCRFDRANSGRSDSAGLPRTSRDMVEDLRLMLAAAGFAPPFLLVGHSFGGLNMQLFARLYPLETARLVLIDSVHPDQIERFYTHSQAAGDSLRSETEAVLQGVDWDASAIQVKTAPPLTSPPLTVISRGRPTPEAAIWSELQADLAAQSPDSRHLIAPNSGHGIQMDEPLVVIVAISDLVRRLRVPAATPPLI